MSIRHDKNSGVTLLEVMVVIVIIGLLSAMAVPQFSKFFALQRLTSASNLVFTDIQLARTLAAKSSTRHYVVFSGGTWKIFREKTGNLGFDGPASETLIKYDTLPPFVQFGIATNFGTKPGTPAGAASFTSSAIPSNGMSKGVAGDNCVDAAASGTGTWDSVIVLCGGRGIPRMESGALYLTTANAPTRIESILYNSADTSGSYQIQRWTYESESWTKK